MSSRLAARPWWLSWLASCWEWGMLVARAIHLALLFAPALLLAQIALRPIGRRTPARRWFVELLYRSLAAGGPAFIKWGQWAASRPDLFAADVCRSLARLHCAAPAHSARVTLSTVESAFGCRLADIFESFELHPLASGSIGQVHRAVIRRDVPVSVVGRPGASVAVKVRHPGVEAAIRRDFALLLTAARALSVCMPSLRFMALDDSVAQFHTCLAAQVDFTAEADLLMRFNHNFRRWPHVSFPQPVYPLVRPAVLVESFESGSPISTYVDAAESVQRAQHDAYIAALVTAGGAIPGDEGHGTHSTRARVAAWAERAWARARGTAATVPPAATPPVAPVVEGTSLPRPEEAAAAAAAAVKTATAAERAMHGDIARTGIHILLKMMLVDKLIHADLHPGNILVRVAPPAAPPLWARALAIVVGPQMAAAAIPPPRPHVVLLDAGMGAELTAVEAHNLLQFFHGTNTTDGDRVASALLAASKSCRDPARFREDMVRMLREFREFWAAQGGVNSAEALAGAPPAIARKIPHPRALARARKGVSTGPAGEPLEEPETCMAAALECVRRNELTMNARYTLVVVTAIMLEGIQRKLDPQLNLMAEVEHTLSALEMANKYPVLARLLDDVGAWIGIV